jgi:hypothetical protein
MASREICIFAASPELFLLKKQHVFVTPNSGE